MHRAEILIGHLREMVGNWPVASCYFALCLHCASWFTTKYEYFTETILWQGRDGVWAQGPRLQTRSKGVVLQWSEGVFIFQVLRLGMRSMSCKLGVDLH